MKVKILSDFKYGDGKTSKHYKPGDEADLPDKVALAYPSVCEPITQKDKDKDKK